MTDTNVGPDLERLIEEALRQRAGLALPSIDQGPVELIMCLTDVRSRLDRVEELLSIAVRFRGRIKTAFKIATEEVEVAWASKISNGTRRSRGGSDGWSDSAPRERYAEADLATLDQKRMQRQLERLLEQAHDAVDVINRAHRGIESFRMDLHLVLRAMNVESVLER